MGFIICASTHSVSEINQSKINNCISNTMFFSKLIFDDLDIEYLRVTNIDNRFMFKLLFKNL